MSTSNLYPSGTNAGSGLGSANIIQSLSASFLGGVITADVKATVDVGKTINTLIMQYPLITASATVSTRTGATLFDNDLLRSDPTLNTNQYYIGTCTVYNITAGTYVFIPVEVVAGTEALNFLSASFNVVNTQQYRISINITYARKLT